MDQKLAEKVAEGGYGGTVMFTKLYGKGRVSGKEMPIWIVVVDWGDG